MKVKFKVILGYDRNGEVRMSMAAMILLIEVGNVTKLLWALKLKFLKIGLQILPLRWGQKVDLIMQL